MDQELWKNSRLDVCKHNHIDILCPFGSLLRRCNDHVLYQWNHHSFQKSLWCHGSLPYLETENPVSFGSICPQGNFDKIHAHNFEISHEVFETIILSLILGKRRCLCWFLQEVKGESRWKLLQVNQRRPGILERRSICDIPWRFSSQRVFQIQSIPGSRVSL